MVVSIYFFVLFFFNFVVCTVWLTYLATRQLFTAPLDKYSIVITVSYRIVLSSSRSRTCKEILVHFSSVAVSFLLPLLCNEI